MSKAWITKEWIDSTGKRRRAKAAPGIKGVKATDRFVVEWLVPSAPEDIRKREKIEEAGRDGKQKADDRCAEINAELTLNLYQDKSRVRWADVKQRFVRDVVPQKRSERTRREITATLARFERIAAPVFMHQITGATIDAFIAARLKEKTREGEPITNATVNKDLRTIKGFFRKIQDDWEAIDRLPKIRMLDEIETEKPTYTSAEFVAMFKQCDITTPTLPAGLGDCPRSLWWRTLLAMFWETGMRRGEMLALEWAGVDFDRQCVTVAPQHTKSKRVKQFHFGDLADQYLRLLATYGADGHVFRWQHELARLNEALGDIQQAAGIDSSRRNFKFHAIRRTVGETTAELYGLTAAQYKLGHSNPQITAKHYAKAAMRSLAQKSAMPIPEGMRIVG